jgi:hypothetical protein
MQDWSDKYRPSFFADLKGSHHQEAVAALRSILRRQELK